MFSDLDLIVVYAPEYREEIMNQRMTIVSGMGSVLAAFTGEHVGEPRLVICLYEAAVPLHVDFKFVMPKELEKRIEDPIILWERGAVISANLQRTPSAYPHPDPQWIEDRFWVWVHYAAAKLGRGELLEVIDAGQSASCRARSAAVGRERAAAERNAETRTICGRSDSGVEGGCSDA